VEEKTQASPQALRGSETILVVEDEEAVREFVSSLLREYGYNVRQASNGVEALDVWQQYSQQIDLVLTDVVMPQKISGIELADKLWKEKQQLKVIFTSGYSRELLDEHFQARTELNFLPKPYHPAKLTELIRVCLDK
jgi:CheY-like chemotaxis protein